MKLETFFEKFELFAEAPDAVAKLRELVLELAVRGQLSERKTEDANDSAWRSFLANFDKRIYGSDPGSPPPFEVPDEWRWVIMTDAADCRAAAKVDSASLQDSDWVLDLEDINGGSGKVIATSTFSERRSLSTKASFQEGDVLYGKLRPYLNKVVIADRPGFCTTEIVPLRPQPFVAPGYLRVFLRSPCFLRYAAAKNYGMKMPRLGTKDLESAQISLPPLAEQKRIVAKVDELMALCGRLEAQQQERETRHAALARASLARFAEAPTLANLKFLFHDAYAIPPADLRKSILTLAVQGKLVPCENEPNMGSLDSILSEASANGVSKGPTLDESSTEILRISAGTSRDDFTVDEDDFKHVDLPPTEIEKFRLKPGDLLACRFNGNLHFVGRFSYYRGESARVQVNPDKLIRFRIKTELNCPRYVCLAMNAGPTRKAIEAMCATTAGNIGLSAGRLKTVKIPLPPLAEQRRIVATVEQLMTLVNTLEQQLAASRATAANLLAAAFTELTGTPTNGKVSAPAASSTGRRGRPRKS